MDHFEVVSIHQSNTRLETDDQLCKLLDVKIKLRLEPIKSLLDTGPSQDDMAKELGKAVIEAFSKIPSHLWGSTDAPKVKFETVPAADKEFGYFEIYNSQS